MPNIHRTREQRVRNLARRHGYRLVKSRSRDPNALDFGGYGLFDDSIGFSVLPVLAGQWVCANELDEVEEWLDALG